MYVLFGRRAVGALLLAVAILTSTSFGQSQVAIVGRDSTPSTGDIPIRTNAFTILLVPNYYSQTDGMSLAEIIRLAFETNGDIKIARLEVDKARARLTQAGLRPNPTLEVEQSSGRLAGSPGDSQFSAGIAVPLELFGRRQRRIDVANAEITLREAEITARQRTLASQIFVSYTEALAALRELQVSEELLSLDVRTVEFVQIRVNEGETPPLELSLLQTEVGRLGMA